MSNYIEKIKKEMKVLCRSEEEINHALNKYPNMIQTLLSEEQPEDIARKLDNMLDIKLSEEEWKEFHNLTTKIISQQTLA